MIGQAFHARVGAGALALVALLPLPALATAAEAEEYQPTFAKDVAPLFQQKCQVCHQPNSIAPMSLLTYADARPWARAIKQKVVARDMPPWYINKHVGIQQFKNDRSLTDDQIDTIARWVDGGAPFGNEADLPAPIEWADPTEWQLAKDFGQPDLIVRSEPFSLPADGQDKWWRPTVDTGLTQARWVRAIEFKPSFPLGRRVIHHALATLIQEEDGVTKLASTAVTDDDDPFTRAGGLFMEWAVGKRGEMFPEGTGKLMLPDSKIRFEVHYHAVGEEVPNDVIELGVYFYPEGYEPESRTVLHAFQANGFEPRHRAEHDRHERGLYRAAGAGTAGELPAAHAYARHGDVAGGDLSGWPHGADQHSGQLPLELARQLHLRRGRGPGASQGDGPQGDRVARQHRREQRQPGSEPVGRLRRPDGGRDGPPLGRRDLPRRRGLRTTGRGAQVEDRRQLIPRLT